MSELVVARTLHIAAHPSLVWEALTSAELLSEWFGDSAEIDLRVGGRGVIDWGDAGAYNFIIDEIDEPNTFAFRWAQEWLDDPVLDRSTLVRFQLVVAAGGTDLTVRQTGWEQFDDDAENFADDAGDLWGEELDELKTFLEKQDSV